MKILKANLREHQQQNENEDIKCRLKKSRETK